MCGICLCYEEAFSAPCIRAIYRYNMLDLGLSNTHHGGTRQARHTHSEQPKEVTMRARQSKAKQSKARQSKAKQSKARQGKAKQSMAKQSKARQSKAEQSRARRSRARRSKAKQSTARQSKSPTLFSGIYYPKKKQVQF